MLGNELKALTGTYFFQNFGNTPQQSSIPLRAFSAICMSALMESMPASIFSSCSNERNEKENLDIKLFSLYYIYSYYSRISKWCEYQAGNKVASAQGIQ